jgi:hypothetical protein
MLVAQDGRGNSRQGQADGEPGGPLVINDVIGGMLHFLRDFAARCLPVVAFQTQAAKLFDGHAGHVRHGPGGKFTVAVFTQDVGMDIMHIHSAVLAQQMTEARAVQHGAGPDDASARPAGPFVGDIRQDVHRIAHNQNDRR